VWLTLTPNAAEQYQIPGWFYTGKYVFTAFVGGGESYRSELEKKKQAKLKVKARAQFTPANMHAQHFPPTCAPHAGPRTS
jgi:hypothetical protein